MSRKDTHALRVIAGHMDKHGLRAIDINLNGHDDRPVEVLVSPEDLMQWRSALDLCNVPEWVSNDYECDRPWSRPVWDEADWGDLPFRVSTVRYDDEMATA